MRIKLKEARPGMVLDEDITLPSGALLIPKSQPLTRDSIGMLETKGITEILIADVKKDQKNTVSSTARQNSSSSENTPAPPKIRVQIANDLMSAKLTLEPASGSNFAEITVEQLHSELERAGVVTGIDEKALHALVDKWRERKRLYEIDKVAVGSAAEPGKEGELEMKVRHVSTRSDLDKIKNAHYFWQGSDILIKAQRVNPDDVIAEKQFGIPPIPGKNVKGEMIFTDEIIKTQLLLSNGVKLSSDGNSVLSKTCGIAYFIDSTIGVNPIDFNGSVEVTVSSDKMTAQLIVHPAGDGGRMPTENDIKALLEKSKIVTGIKSETISIIASDCAREKYPLEPVSVAEGTPSKSGDNGKMEFLFSRESSLKPTQNTDGSVDYKNVDIVHTVVTGQHLVKLIAPTKGIPGKNVFGELIKCEDGVAEKHPAGTNTEPDTKDTQFLNASVDGMVRWNGSLVEINEGYIIPGDVNFSTGHVKYEKTVMVNGDVKTGFNIECGSDLQVAGTIEDCLITVGGNILCKYGFVGSGKGVIDSKGDVNLGFMKNQIIRSKGNVNIAKEALNCTIFARQTIQVHGNPVSVAGGNLTARDSITVSTVGNHSGIRTTLEIGIDFTLIDELKKTDIQLAELNENYRKIVETNQKYEKLASLRKLADKDRELIAKLKTTLTKYHQQISILEDRKKTIASRLYDFENSYVKVERSAMPGTVVKIGERHFLIKEELIGPKTIRLVNHEIRCI